LRRQSFLFADGRLADHVEGKGGGLFSERFQRSAQGAWLFIDDEATRQARDVLPRHRRQQPAGVERLREEHQPAEGVIDFGEVFFQVAANICG